MKRNKFLIGLFAALLASLTACSKIEAGGFVEAPKCNGTVKVIVCNPGSTRASSSFLEDNIDRFTATRVDTKTNYTLVSYHGRNMENIGMVQLISQSSGAVLSEVVFTDARVNFAQMKLTSNSAGVVYVGVDRKGGNSVLCGIVCIPVKDNKFYVGESNEANLEPTKVEGVSINCIKQNFGDTKTIGMNTMVVASGGNDALGDNVPAGFTKFEINKEDPTKLSVLATQTAANYRGYWFSFGYNNGAPLAYTYRTVEGGDLVYKLGVLPYNIGVDMFSNNVNSNFIRDYASKGAEVEIWRNVGQTESRARYCTIAIKKNPGYKFIIVSSGVKEGGGVQIYRFSEKDPATGQPSLTLVDTWEKTAVCLSTEVIVNDQYYIFAGCGDGIYKLRIDFDLTDKDAALARIVPETKYTDIGTTESGSLSSINYMQIKGGGSSAKVHVAGGYKGYYILNLSDFTTPCDPRKD